MSSLTILYYIVILIGIAFFGITVFEVIKFRLNRKESYQKRSNNDDSAGVEIKSELMKAKKTVFITTGNCNPDFYGREEVINVLEDAAKRKVLIKIISGKIEEADNPIKKLSDSFTNVQLYIYPGNYLNPHFRIIDNKDLFLEELHAPSEKRRYFSYYANNSFLVRKFLNLFYKLLSRSTREPSTIDFNLKKEEVKENA